MRELKTGLNADKFATSCLFSKSFYHSVFQQMSLIHSPNRWKQVDLRDFEKHENI